MRNPQRNIPLALGAGTFVVIIIYVLTNLAYLYIMPIADIAGSNRVAADIMDRVLPGYGGGLISLAVMISTFGSVNGSTMTTARVFFAMAKDRLFFKGHGRCPPEIPDPGQGPHRPMCVGVPPHALRHVRPAVHLRDVCRMDLLRFRRGRSLYPPKEISRVSRPYSLPGYPVVPILFVGVATWFVLNTLVANSRFPGRRAPPAPRNPVLFLLEKNDVPAIVIQPSSISLLTSPSNS